MEYKISNLKYLTTYIARGITPKYTDDKENGLIILNQKCIRDYKINLKEARMHNIKEKKVSNERILKKYDILINSTGVGTAGRVAQNTEMNSEMSVDSHITIVRPDESKIDPLYLGYAIKEQQSIIEKMAEGSTGQTEISRNRLGEEILVKYPRDIDIQRKTANILYKIDKRIELNNKINDNLQKIANNVFIKWFCDFDYPTVDSKNYRSSGGKMIDTELGKIPENWKIGLFQDLIEFSNGYGFKSSDLLDKKAENTLKVFKQGNINLCGGINEEKTKSWIYKEKCIGLEKFILKKGDILMCMTDMKNSTSPLLGHTALMNVNNEYVVNQRVGLIRCKKEETDYPYVYTMTNLEYFLKDIRSRANSGVQVNLSTKGICETRIVIPTKEIMNKFNKFAKSLYENMFNNQKENQKLKQLRDTLLTKLMNGEININKIEI